MERAAIGFPSPGGFMAHITYFRFSLQERIFYLINTSFPDFFMLTPAVMEMMSSASSTVE